MDAHTLSPVVAIVGVTVGLVILLYGVAFGNQTGLQLVGGGMTVVAVGVLAAYLHRAERLTRTH